MTEASRLDTTAAAPQVAADAPPATGAASAEAAGADLPAWADDMRRLFAAGGVSQAILHGNIFDAVLGPGGRLLALKSYLDDILFPSYDVVLHYDRGRGIRATRGGADWTAWLQDALGTGAQAMIQAREPGAALELIDRYLLRSLHLRNLGEAAGRGPGPRRIAVVVDFAEFVVPRGDPIQLGGSFSANVVKVLGWANDPAILASEIVTVLVTENLNDLNGLVADNPRTGRIAIPLPTAAEMVRHLEILAATEFPGLAERSDLALDVLARRLTGLNRITARRAIAAGLQADGRITSAWLTRVRRDLIEEAFSGLLEFVESPTDLDDVAGLDAVKAWLREDALLLRRGSVRALPMGYLIAGRIGTGKTFLVRSWAGELGIPCVVLKNFRDRWVGATESNLERIFAVLRALGQVVVFVDEADQAAGRRDSGGSDSGLSGRVYSMLAQEMANTANRGRIIWVLATSRPDLLEVDLKRPGRLDVHIPLFPPDSPDEVRAMFRAVARKLGLALEDADLPPIDDRLLLGGNEIEAILVRALRRVELAGPRGETIADALRAVVADVRPTPHSRKLEYMDLVAVRECTDRRFLPARFRDLSAEEIDRRLADLAPFV